MQGRSHAHAFLWSGLNVAATRAVSLLVFIGLGRLISPEHFGVFAICLLVVLLGEVVLDQAASEALVQAPNVDDALLNAVFWIQLTVATAIAAGVLAAAPLLSRILDEPNLTAPLSVGASSLLFTATGSVPQALLRRKLNFRGLTTRNVLSSIVSGAIGLSLAGLGWGIWSLVCMQIANAGVASAAALAFARWRPAAPTFVAPQHPMRALMHFAGIVSVTRMLDIVQQKGEQLLLLGALGASSVGQYSFAQRIVEIMRSIVLQAPSEAGLSIVARRSQANVDIIPAVEMLMTITMFIAACATGIVAAGHFDLVLVAFGPQWSTAASVVGVLVLGLPAQAISYTVGTTMVAVGRPGRRLQINSVSALLTLSLGIIFAPLGVEAVAAAICAKAWVMAGWTLTLARGPTGVSPFVYLARCVRPAVCGILTFVGTVGAVRVFHSQSPALVALAVVAVGLLITLLTGWLLIPEARLWLLKTVLRNGDR